jgi:hypothetical protein
MILIAVFSSLVFLHSLVSQRLERFALTVPIVFTAAGFLIFLVLGLPEFERSVFRRLEARAQPLGRRHPRPSARSSPNLSQQLKDRSGASTAVLRDSRPHNAPPRGCGYDACVQPWQRSGIRLAKWLIFPWERELFGWLTNAGKRKWETPSPYLEPEPRRRHASALAAIIPQRRPQRGSRAARPRAGEAHP